MSIPSPHNISASAAPAINVAVGLIEQREGRLLAILESKEATPKEKFQALVDLAHLAGILLREVAAAEERTTARGYRCDRETPTEPVKESPCMTTPSEPRITFSDRMDNGVVIGFDDGKTAYYSAVLLRAVLLQAVMMPSDSEDSGLPNGE